MPSHCSNIPILKLFDTMIKNARIPLRVKLFKNSTPQKGAISWAGISPVFFICLFLGLLLALGGIVTAFFSAKMPLAGTILSAYQSQKTDMLDEIDRELGGQGLGRIIRPDLLTLDAETMEIARGRVNFAADLTEKYVNAVRPNMEWTRLEGLVKAVQGYLDYIGWLDEQVAKAKSGDIPLALPTDENLAQALDLKVDKVGEDSIDPKPEVSSTVNPLVIDTLSTEAGQSIFLNFTHPKYGTVDDLYDQLVTELSVLQRASTLNALQQTAEQSAKKDQLYFVSIVLMGGGALLFLIGAIFSKFALAGGASGQSGGGTEDALQNGVRRLTNALLGVLDSASLVGDQKPLWGIDRNDCLGPLARAIEAAVSRMNTVSSQASFGATHTAGAVITHAPLDVSEVVDALDRRLAVLSAALQETLYGLQSGVDEKLEDLRTAYGNVYVESAPVDQTEMNLLIEDMQEMLKSLEEQQYLSHRRRKDIDVTSDKLATTQDQLHKLLRAGHILFKQMKETLDEFPEQNRLADGVAASLPVLVGGVSGLSLPNSLAEDLDFVRSLIESMDSKLLNLYDKMENIGQQVGQASASGGRDVSAITVLPDALLALPDRIEDALMDFQRQLEDMGNVTVLPKDGNSASGGDISRNVLQSIDMLIETVDRSVDEVLKRFGDRAITLEEVIRQDHAAINEHTAEQIAELKKVLANRFEQLQSQTKWAMADSEKNIKAFLEALPENGVDSDKLAEHTTAEITALRKSLANRLDQLVGQFRWALSDTENNLKTAIGQGLGADVVIERVEEELKSLKNAIANRFEQLVGQFNSLLSAAKTQLADNIPYTASDDQNAEIIKHTDETFAEFKRTLSNRLEQLVGQFKSLLGETESNLRQAMESGAGADVIATQTSEDLQALKKAIANRFEQLQSQFRKSLSETEFNLREVMVGNDPDIASLAVHTSETITDLRKALANRFEQMSRQLNTAVTTSEENLKQSLLGQAGYTPSMGRVLANKEDVDALLQVVSDEAQKFFGQTDDVRLALRDLHAQLMHKLPAEHHWAEVLENLNQVSGQILSSSQMLQDAMSNPTLRLLPQDENAVSQNKDSLMSSMYFAEMHRDDLTDKITTASLQGHLSQVADRVKTLTQAVESVLEHTNFLAEKSLSGLTNEGEDTASDLDKENIDKMLQMIDRDTQTVIESVHKSIERMNQLATAVALTGDAAHILRRG